jgi:hypothetical protein
VTTGPQPGRYQHERRRHREPTERDVIEARDAIEREAGF